MRGRRSCRSGRQRTCGLGLRRDDRARATAPARGCDRSRREIVREPARDRSRAFHHSRRRKARACSRKISAETDKSKALPNPMRVGRPAQTIHQSGLASPGGSRKARCREMRRSELVTVPSFSPHAAAGSSTCGAGADGVGRPLRRPTRRRGRERRSALRTASARGRLTAGLVPMTQSALMRPSATASNKIDGLEALAAWRRQAHSRSGGPGRRSRHQSPCAPRAGWRARRPRARPWRWVGR